MKKLRSALFALLPALALGCGVSTVDPSLETTGAAQQSLSTAPQGGKVGKGGGTLQTAHPAQGASRPIGTLCTDNGITNHGGGVMLGNVNIYYIWYGNWAGNTATTILTDWANNFGSSQYYNINTTYYDGANNHVSNAAHFAGGITDNYSRGTSLADADIQAIVSGALTSGHLPTDSNGVYFVLTSADVHETSGFCTAYCGWHTHATLNGVDIKYSTVGNGDQCPAACEAQTTSPNGNAGADGMVSVLAHEFEETTSDPDLNAWYDTNGEENADKCAWNFGTEYTVNGAQANVRMGNRDYLIQQNWVNSACGYCALGYGPSSAHLVVTSNANNTHYDYVLIDDPFFNNKPNLVVTATAVWNPPGAAASFNNHPIGVWYSTYYNKWAVFNEDSATMPVGPSFFVYGAYASGTNYTATSTAANVGGDTLWLDNPAINGNPNAFVLATPNWNPGGFGGAFDTKNIGVWYYSGYGKWGIFQEDGSTMPTGLAFNVLVSPGTMVQKATAGNSSGNSTYINNALSNGNPNATVFATQHWNPGGVGGTFNNKTVGVWYNTSLAQWSVFNEDSSAMPVNAGFDIWILP